jgi:glutamate racemase
VIGGERTIQSGVYEHALAAAGKQLSFCSAQPLSAFVESGELSSPAVDAEVRRVLDRLGPIDALLIACTHYPALTPVFTRISPALELLDPGDEMTASLHEEGSKRFEFFTTGDRGASARAARLAFGIEIDGGADARTTQSSKPH